MAIKQRLSFSLFLMLFICLRISSLVRAVHEFRRDDFPQDFVFGAGSSAYQVEGAAFEDGRTPSIWDTFTNSDHWHGGNGEVACDVYHKYKEDIRLMVDTGLEAYRFSISWSRLIPNGRGQVNPKGLQFYNNFINELIHHGIQPHVTLFHDDLPQVLEDEYGGWLSRKAVKDFVGFANVCFKEFGDRVLHWSTFNEANIFSLGGYDVGILPPARCSSPFGLYCTEGNSSVEPYIVGHNILLAHASATRLYYKKYKVSQHGMIGINLFAYWFTPCTNSTEDKTATQRANDFYVGWFVNPLVFGDYPEVMKKNAEGRIPLFTKLESNLVKGSFDFIGLNHYSTLKVEDRSSSLEKKTRDYVADMGAHVILSLGSPNDFAINPSGLYNILDYFKQMYRNPPIFIHENGQQTRRNETLEDISRVDYLHAYIGSLLDAIRNGSNTRGYFMWSFLDSFELLDGFESAFGIYYVDLDDKNLTRYPKLSAHWYSDFLKGGNITAGFYDDGVHDII
jgi:beta-glucosidase